MITPAVNNTSGLYARPIEKTQEAASQAPKVIDLQLDLSADGTSPTPTHLRSVSHLIQFQSDYFRSIEGDMEGGEYAHVYRGGEKIGEISNSGSVALPMIFPYPDGGPVQGGPELAQWRAERLREMGLEVRVADTAVPQDQWDSWQRPSISLEAIDAYVSSRFEALSQASISREI